MNGLDNYNLDRIPDLGRPKRPSVSETLQNAKAQIAEDSMNILVIWTDSKGMVHWTGNTNLMEQHFLAGLVGTDALKKIMG